MYFTYNGVLRKPRQLPNERTSYAQSNVSLMLVKWQNVQYAIRHRGAALATDSGCDGLFEYFDIIKLL